MSDRPWLSAYPEGVPADIDVQAYDSLVQLLEQAFQRFGPRVAFSFMGQELSYAQLDAQSRALAAYLQSLGLVRGDRVAIMAANSPAHLLLMFALARLRAIFVPVNPEFGISEAGYMTILLRT